MWTTTERIPQLNHQTISLVSKTLHSQLNQFSITTYMMILKHVNVLKTVFGVFGGVEKSRFGEGPLQYPNPIRGPTSKFFVVWKFWYHPRRPNISVHSITNVLLIQFIVHSHFDDDDILSRQCHLYLWSIQVYRSRERKIKMSRKSKCPRHGNRYLEQSTKCDTMAGFIVCLSMSQIPISTFCAKSENRAQ